MIASSPRWGAAFAAAFVSTLSIAGCGEFGHTNPLDSRTPVAVEITGPDSAFSLLDTVTFVAHTSPSYSPESVSWTALPYGLLQWIGNGSFQVASFAPQTGTVTVRVEADGRIAERKLTFVHRTTSMRVEECASHSKTLTFDALGQNRVVCLLGFDARGYPSPIQMPTVTVSDPSVVATGTPSPLVNVTARGNGTAVVRLSMLGMTDSVTVTVRQRIVSVWLAPAQCRTLENVLTIGDSLQVTPTSVGWDQNNNLIADTARVRAAVRGMTFSLGGDMNYGGVKVSSTGMVTAVQALGGSVVGLATTPEEGTVRGICYFVGQNKR